MSLYQKLHSSRLMFASLLMMPLLVSCYDYRDDEQIQQDVSDKYINLKISVSTINHATRADKPASGENGDGREAGFERENKVDGITLVLYQGTEGINAAGSTKIDFVQYFPTTKDGTAVDPETSFGDTKGVEVTYTTGDQKLKYDLDVSKDYHAIVIANANLDGRFVAGTTTLDDVRDYQFAYIYSGGASTPAADVDRFIMTSEADAELKFSTKGALEGNAFYYRFTGSSDAIRIERLAARIDFWAKGATYVTMDAGGVNTLATPGYKYNVIGSSDWFVVTRITPFNLNRMMPSSSTEGGEYLIKRLSTDLSKPSKTVFLDDEAKTKYVIDPSMSKKTDPSSFPYSYNSKLQTEVIDRYAADPVTISSNPYSRTMADLKAAVVDPASTTAGYKSHKESSSETEGYPNFIIGYAMENTLLPNSPLVNFATGIAIEGDYYPAGSNADPTKVKRYVYYGYLRHQGTSSSPGLYTAYEADAFKTTLTTISALGSSYVMPFGVVRNNIYRIYIDHIDKKGSMELLIKVKKWDPYIHDFIYM